MKMLVLGGSGGVGKAIADHFKADSVSRSTGHGMPYQLDAIEEVSYNYDVIVNTIPDERFQTMALDRLYTGHCDKILNTYFITFGSMAWHLYPEERDLVDWIEKNAVKSATAKHTLLNTTWCWNSRDAAILPRVQPQEILDTIEFLLKYRDHAAVISMIEIKGN